LDFLGYLLIFSLLSLAGEVAAVVLAMGPVQVVVDSEAEILEAEAEATLFKIQLCYKGTRGK